MSYIGSKTQQVRSSSSHLQEVIPLPSALPGPALGPPSSPSFSTANLLFQLAVKIWPQQDPAQEAQALIPSMLCEAWLGAGGGSKVAGPERD